jgi:hypothetical protein
MAQSKVVNTAKAKTPSGTPKLPAVGTFDFHRDSRQPAEPGRKVLERRDFQQEPGLLAPGTPDFCRDCRRSKVHRRAGG